VPELLDLDWLQQAFEADMRLLTDRVERFNYRPFRGWTLLHVIHVRFTVEFEKDLKQREKN
jgi:hypothetical protein